MLAIAAQPGTREPAFVDLPEPAYPRTGEVLCETLQLGVCGTDRDILDSADPAVPPGAEWLVLGHECLGRVVETGPGETGFAVGDLVAPFVRRAKPGASGRVDLIPLGRYTERGIVEEHGFSAPRWLDRPEHLCRVPPDVAEMGVFIEPLAVAEKAVNEALAVQRGRLGPDAWSDPPPRVLVTGLGPIGFAGLLAAAARRWPVTVFGRDPADTFRARLVRDLGGVYLPAAEADFQPADVEAAGYDLILECTGSDAVLLQAAGALATLGVMTWLGSSRRPQPASHNVSRLMRDGLLRNHAHIGCVNAAPRDFSDAVRDLGRFLAERPEAVRKLLTHRVSPRESLPHFVDRVPQGIKTVLVYDRS